MMLRTAILVLTFSGACTAAYAAEPQYPYRGYINSADVYLRSGPGENYYPVSKLTRGQAVEVYRHDPGGWYAIRPTDECFSWVSGEFIEPAEGNLAVVNGERVVARVGSKFSDIRDVIQVHLDQGEVVEVLEAKRFNSGPAAQTWYKIAPPAGEFRWVSGQFIDRDLPESQPRETGPENNLLLSRTEDEEGEYDAREHGVSDQADDYPVRQTGGERSRSARLARHDRQARDDDGDPLLTSDDDSYGDHGAPRREVAAALDRLRRDKRTVSVAGDEIELDDADLNVKDLAVELDLQLSAMVADEPSEWDFSSLERRAQAGLARAQTALDRGRVRRVLHKIEHFDDLQRRYETVMNVQQATDRANDKLDSLASSTSSSPAPRSLSSLGERPRYDGSGRLTQVLSRDPRSPQFALLNENGQVAYYVSPSPGVNLRRFLNQQVGIHGTLGYLPEQQAQHVTAQRIVSLDARMTR
jgi:hypothetical protein